MNTKVLLFLIFVCASARGQIIKDLDISLINTSKNYPFSSFSTLHPGIQIGASIRERIKAKSERNYNVYLGFYHQEDLENGLFLRAEYAHTFIILKQIGLTLPIGLGYLHTFFPGELFSQNSDGSFSKVNQTGRMHVLATSGVGLSYRGFKTVELYVQHDFAVQYPFSEAIPLLPNAFFRIGIKYNIN
ncbi:hypothetical protein [Winogradskyella sp.]|uniref:hypothetical protein n=1 Tax=Winogradskyella sp. TaxID=1883156 RepID=UPI003BABBABC